MPPHQTVDTEEVGEHRIEGEGALGRETGRTETLDAVRRGVVTDDAHGDIVSNRCSVIRGREHVGPVGHGTIGLARLEGCPPPESSR